MKYSKLGFVFVMMLFFSCDENEISPPSPDLSEKLETYFKSQGIAVDRSIDLELLKANNVSMRPVSSLAIEVSDFKITDSFVDGIEAILRSAPQHKNADLSFLKKNLVKSGRTQSCSSSWTFYSDGNNTLLITCSNCDSGDSSWQCMATWLPSET